MPGIERLRDFVGAMTRLAEAGADDGRWLTEGRALLERLVAEDEWLPEEFVGPARHTGNTCCTAIRWNGSAR
jgi:predicted metal-dependent enzyme (double-stranded beta helix superfamily)